MLGTTQVFVQGINDLRAWRRRGLHHGRTTHYTFDSLAFTFQDVQLNCFLVKTFAEQLCSDQSQV